ncbi:hypothetical protein ACFT2C_09130 [Promicromonospora sp. NPDC057138]|uniref:hypothetical protein n=1 Tax=Promicromonospora sp. NPDC057138 TaxID=3346031 RepID=UPI003637AC1D
MRKLIAALGITAAVTLTLGACTADPESADTPPAVEPTEGDAPLPEDAYETPEVATAQFGDTGYEFEDGLAVSVSEGESFKPSKYAVSDEAPHYLKWTVTFTNGTDEPWRAIDTVIAVASGGVEYSEVYDDGVGEQPSVPLPPGESASYDVAFGVEDPTDVRMSVTPDFADHAVVLFTDAQHG